jgi:thiosulfate dehydrogenase (quinone) large subunit
MQISHQYDALVDRLHGRSIVSSIRSAFDSKIWAWIWLVVRLYLGGQWLAESIAKVSGFGWVGRGAGAFLRAWVTMTLRKTTGPHPTVPAWYGAFLAHVVLPHAAVCGYVIVAGEISVGLGLVVGLFTGIAALGGAFMNLNYMLAGEVSINPLFFALGALLVLVWKTAGTWGLDRYVLPMIASRWRGPAK